MRPIKFKVFEENNIYSDKKCIKLDLDMEGLENVFTTEIDGLEYELLTMLPELVNHQCCTNEDSGLAHKLNRGIQLHHLCGHIALAVQDRAGINVGFCSQSRCCTSNCYTIYEYKYKNSGIEAGRIAVDVINYFTGDDLFDLDFRLEILKEMFETEQSAVVTFI
ncbi:cyanophycin synthetase family protein [Clostridium oryzae]|uniref:Cyanophycin synthetase n=1 Tax=Clostridium oryzae TaxID=1450648 RepID=A0A1V4IDR5_9CLOT|nr:hypothetical protein [Clostridium oryzae]OPJ58059.1 cyanophycin synthetase [Clostridium oryzae]